MGFDYKKFLRTETLPAKAKKDDQQIFLDVVMSVPGNYLYLIRELDHIPLSETQKDSFIDARFEQGISEIYFENPIYVCLYSKKNVLEGAKGRIDLDRYKNYLQEGPQTIHLSFIAEFDGALGKHPIVFVDEDVIRVMPPIMINELLWNNTEILGPRTNRRVDLMTYPFPTVERFIKEYFQGNPEFLVLPTSPFYYSWTTTEFEEEMERALFIEQTPPAANEKYIDEFIRTRNKDQETDLSQIYIRTYGLDKRLERESKGFDEINVIITLECLSILGLERWMAIKDKIKFLYVEKSEGLTQGALISDELVFGVNYVFLLKMVKQDPYLGKGMLFASILQSILSVFKETQGMGGVASHLENANVMRKCSVRVSTGENYPVQRQIEFYETFFKENKTFYSFLGVPQFLSAHISSEKSSLRNLTVVRGIVTSKFFDLYCYGAAFDHMEYFMNLLTENFLKKNINPSSVKVLMDSLRSHINDILDQKLSSEWVRRLLRPMIHIPLSVYKEHLFLRDLLSMLITYLTYVKDNPKVNLEQMTKTRKEVFRLFKNGILIREELGIERTDPDWIEKCRLLMIFAANAMEPNEVDSAMVRLDSVVAWASSKKVDSATQGFINLAKKQLHMITVEMAAYRWVNNTRPLLNSNKLRFNLNREMDRFIQQWGKYPDFGVPGSYVYQFYLNRPINRDQEFEELMGLLESKDEKLIIFLEEHFLLASLAYVLTKKNDSEAQLSEVDEYLVRIKTAFKHSKTVDLIILLSQHRWNDVVTEAGRILEGHQETMRHDFVLTCVLYAYYKLNHNDKIVQTFQSILDISQDGQIIGSVLYSMQSIMFLLPQQAREFILEGIWLDLKERMTEKRLEKDDEVRLFLAKSRTKGLFIFFKEFLLNELHQGQPSASKIKGAISFLEYYADPATYKIFEGINGKAISSQEVRTIIVETKRRLYEAVKYDQEIFRPEIETLFHRGEYGELRKRAEEYLKGDDYSGMAAQLNEWVDQSRRIEQYIQEATEALCHHDYELADAKLEMVQAMNANDPSFVNLVIRVKKFIDAQMKFQAGLFTEAKQLVLAGQGKKIQTLEAAFVAKVEEYQMALDLIHDGNPDLAKLRLEPLFKRFPKDYLIDQKNKDIEDLLVDRQRLLNEASEALSRKDFPVAVRKNVSAFEKSWQVETMIRSMEGFLIRLINLVNKKYELAVDMAKKLIGKNPKVSAFKRLKAQAWANLTLIQLKPKQNILSALYVLRENRKKRITGHYGAEYFYEALEFADDDFADYFWIRKIQFKKAEGGDLLDVDPRNIAYRGESVSFWKKDSAVVSEKSGRFPTAAYTNGDKDKPVMDDYFRIMEVSALGIKFHIENVRKISDIKATLLAQGRFKKADNSVLARQKRVFEDVVNTLSLSLMNVNSDPTTGFNCLDLLLGFKEIPLALWGKDEIVLLDERIRADLDQMKAVLQGVNLNNRVTLIQGPPGTGKTSTISEIVNQYLKRGRKILVVSQSNPAVNNVGEKFHDLGIPFIRLGNDEENISEKVMPYWMKRAEVLERFNKGGQQGALVVLGTTNGFLGDRAFRKSEILKFDVVIIEEAARATIAEKLLPISMAISKLILVGDHFQLRPYGVSSEDVDDARMEYALMTKNPYSSWDLPPFDDVFSISQVTAYKDSLFEWTFKMCDSCGNAMDRHMLKVNRRSHPRIVSVVTLFYGGVLKTKEHHPDIQVPRDDTLKLIDMVGPDMILRESFCNIAEINQVLEEMDLILHQLDPNGGAIYRYNPEDITIISPYALQNEMLALAIKLKIVIDKVRSNAQIEDADRKVLAKSLRDNMNAFTRSFIENPSLENLGRFLLAVKFVIPTSRQRIFTEADMQKVQVMVNTIDSIQGH
ncbi:MAG: AAA family ATPase, partial [Candidatus Omnitrophica bacterium]|nr:AAA family ATPase [Candidatus Omnitrophota bacterium]